MGPEAKGQKRSQVERNICLQRVSLASLLASMEGRRSLAPSGLLSLLRKAVRGTEDKQLAGRGG
jgi:hypothetical protein